MAVAGSPRDAVRLRCICGHRIQFDGHLLGQVMSCPYCNRYLRPALQFLLVDQALAPNLTAQCTCGHFIVEGKDKAGKRTRCKVCKSHLLLPDVAVKFNGEAVVRVPRKSLKSQLKRVDGGRQRAMPEMGRLKSATHAGRISLRPGEHICANPNCGALLAMRANVCPKCGTNRLTGERYVGAGPAKDPVGTWHEV
jgi:DNA-directed RNA polymerase subunit RPC12/RpoP